MAKKKEKYRLEPLLTVKERHKKQCEIELSRAIKKVAEEKKQLEVFEEEKVQINNRKREARLQMGRSVGYGQTRIYDSHLHLNYLEKLQDDLLAKEQQIKQQHEIIAQAEENVKKKRRDYIDASKDLQSMQKHKELWRKSILKKLEFAEQKEMNELGNVIHQMRKNQ